MKKILTAVFILTLSVTLTAQGYQKGKTWIGPTVGYGLGFGFGASAEYGAFNKIGVGVEIAFQNFEEDGSYSFSNRPYQWKWKYNLFGGLLSATYHFSNNEVFDPFVKVGIGYFNYDAEYSDNSGSTIKFNSAAYTSGLGYTGQLGFRYHFAETTSLRMSAGWPFYIAGGIDFSF